MRGYKACALGMVFVACTLSGVHARWHDEGIPDEWIVALQKKVDSVSHMGSMTDRVAQYIALLDQALRQKNIAEPEHVALARYVRQAVLTSLKKEVEALRATVTLARSIGKNAGVQATQKQSAVERLQQAIEGLELADTHSLARSVQYLSHVTQAIPELTALCGPVEMVVQKVESSHKSKGVPSGKIYKNGSDIAAKCTMVGLLGAAAVVGLCFFVQARYRSISDESSVIVLPHNVHKNRLPTFRSIGVNTV